MQDFECFLRFSSGALVLKLVWTLVRPRKCWSLKSHSQRSTCRAPAPLPLDAHPAETRVQLRWSTLCEFLRKLLAVAPEVSATALGSTQGSRLQAAVPAPSQLLLTFLLTCSFHCRRPLSLQCCSALDFPNQARHEPLDADAAPMLLATALSNTHQPGSLYALF